MAHRERTVEQTNSSSIDGTLAGNLRELPEAKSSLRGYADLRI